MVKRYDLNHLIYIGEQYEVERKLSRWSLDGGLALAVLRDLATLQREADGMREALGGISEHAENQDINHLDFRIHAKRCADQALEACSPQATVLEDK